MADPETSLAVRLALLSAVAAVLVAVGTAGAAEPLGVTALNVTATSSGLVTVGITLNKPWKSGVLAPSSTTSLRVLYDSNGDAKPDYTGTIVYRGNRLVELLKGHGNNYEPVPVSRPTSKKARFTHPIEPLFTGVKHRKALRIAVVMKSGATTSRSPSTGWLPVPQPR